MVAVALALILSACGGDVEATGEILPFDPTSTADVAVAGGAGLGPIFPAPVEVRIIDVLAAAPETAPPEGSFVVDVAGGAVSVMLDPDQARLLGVLEVPEGAEEGPGAEEVEVPVTGPVEITWGHAPSEVLVERNRYVLFLSETETARYDGSGSDRRWKVVDPAGVFEQGDDGRWRPQRDFASGPVVLSAVVSLVSGR